MATKPPTPSKAKKATKAGKAAPKPAAKKPAAKKAAKPAQRRKPGPVSLYTPELAERICALLADQLSLRQICKKPGFPDRTTVNRWLADNVEFATKYARAREQQADAIFDDLEEIEKKTMLGKIDPAVARVVLGSKQWRASKLAPKRYGEKLALGQADDLLPLVTVKDLTGRK